MMIDKNQREEMKKLIAFARMKNKVLPLEKAFEMHPVEEEAHEGKIEYWKGRQKRNEM